MPTTNPLPTTERRLVIACLIGLLIALCVLIYTAYRVDQTFNKPIQSHNSSGYNQ